MKKTMAFFSFLAISAYCHAQECSQLLVHGIYDVKNSTNDSERASSFSQWFCDMRFSSSQSTEDFGGSVAFPFKNIPIQFGFNSSSDNWTQWYSKFCQDSQSNQSFKQRIQNYERQINPDILQAFNQCISSEGLHVWLERTSDPRLFRFAAQFNSSSSDNNYATITQFDQRNNVSCTSQPNRITRAGWRTNCDRLDDEQVSIVVNADYSPHGGGSLELPKIQHYSPIIQPTLRSGLANGERCTDLAECASGYCQPGPSPNPIATKPSRGGEWYCVAAHLNCAFPKSDGYKYGDTMMVQGSTLTCMNPNRKNDIGETFWGQFMCKP